MSAEIERPRNVHAQYHAHVYFDATTLEQGRRLCEDAAARFGVAMGRVHSRPVGPHPQWSCQLAFGADKFDTLIPWLDQHRGGLSVLVHGLSDNDLQDHTTHASWLGQPWTLNLSMFGQKPSTDHQSTTRTGDHP